MCRDMFLKMVRTLVANSDTGTVLLAGAWRRCVRSFRRGAFRSTSKLIFLLRVTG